MNLFLDTNALVMSYATRPKHPPHPLQRGNKSGYQDEHPPLRGAGGCLICSAGFVNPAGAERGTESSVVLPDIPILQSRRSLLMKCSLIRQGGPAFDIRHRHMEEVDIHPPRHIKPDFDEKIGILFASPTHIRRISVEMSPNDLIASLGQIFPAFAPAGFDHAFVLGVDDCADSQIIDKGVACGAT